MLRVYTWSSVSKGIENYDASFIHRQIVQYYKMGVQKMGVHKMGVLACIKFQM